MLGRPQIQPYAQFLMGAGTAVVTVTVAAIDVHRIGLPYLLALGEIVVSCLAMAIVWHYKPSKHLEWVSLVPLASILACVPIRDAAVDVLPTAGMLVIFPTAWLAFAFGAPVLVIGLVLTLLLPATTMLRSGTVPSGLGDWLTIVALPVTLTLFALAARVVARDLRVHRVRAHTTGRRLERALRSSTRNTATLRELLDATPDAVFVFGVDGEPLLVNGPAAEMARRAQTPIGLAPHPEALVFGDDRLTRLGLGPGFRDDVLAGRFTQPGRVWIGEPGEQVAVRFAARPIVADGEVIGALMVAHDVTELVEAVTVRDSFLDTVGHELRTPLTVILGHADLAVAEEGGADRDRWDAVARAAERLEKTVELMLSAGRTQIAAPAAPTEVRTAVAAAVQACDPVPRGVRIEILGADAQARISAGDLTTIVRELLHNAVAVSPEGGRVRVIITRAARRVGIAVEDEGPGMTSGERRQAFDRFYRTAYVREHAIQGVGLGLALAKSLADAHGADIRLLPRAPRGTRAELLLPLA